MSTNSFLVQTISLTSEWNHVVTLTGHEMHCIKNYADCNFRRVILIVYQRWIFHYKNKLWMLMNHFHEYLMVYWVFLEIFSNFCHSRFVLLWGSFWIIFNYRLCKIVKLLLAFQVIWMIDNFQRTSSIKNIQINKLLNHLIIK